MAAASIDRQILKNATYFWSWFYRNECGGCSATPPPAGNAVIIQFCLSNIYVCQCSSKFCITFAFHVINTLILNMATLCYYEKKKCVAFFSISQVAYWCPSSLYHFWMLWILLNTPSKRDFPKISENGHFGFFFDFASGFLLSRFCSHEKNSVSTQV